MWSRRTELREEGGGGGGKVLSGDTSCSGTCWTLAWRDSHALPGRGNATRLIHLTLERFQSSGKVGFFGFFLAANWPQGSEYRTKGSATCVTFSQEATAKWQHLACARVINIVLTHKQTRLFVCRLGIYANLSICAKLKVFVFRR